MDNKRKLSFKRASFIKVLEDEFTKKLPLPPAFAKIFEDYIPPWLILEISGTRKCWRVDIEEDENGNLCLSCGFDCFVKAHSVEVGNFLLFELEEPSILQVKIYEKDGSEKTVGTTHEAGYEGGAFESPRKTPSTHKEGEASPWPTTPLGTNFESRYEVGAFESPTETPLIHKEAEASPWSKPPSVQNGAYQMQPSFIDRSTRKKCILSTTKHGLCFSLTWRKASHLTYYLTIPKAMLNGKPLSNKDTVTLQNQEGSSWPVELRIRADGRVDLAKGWREFVVDNELVTGDTLKFEFVSNNVIQVNVGRASQVDNPSQREQECKIEPMELINMTCENEELAANCIINNAPGTMDKYERVSLESKSPSFSLTWTEKTRNSYLHIPKAIAIRQKLENKDIVVLCDPEGKKWLMEVRTRQSDGRVGLGRGWIDFTKSYGFGVGDTLVFEFVTNHMMNVNIVKAGGLNHAVTGDIDKATSVETSLIAQTSQNSPWDPINAKSLF
ncbi:B3 domain-containing protein REM13-like [Chenopodium quinoa]|uniref:B3 domain-containing protein REM13-like n=1 Tax=Chenopodium quinoa TaxID=63459 RepID=UPI000B784680|nr:B3 domain-containing protein REM13-like [Chenopodium quinoa]